MDQQFGWSLLNQPNFDSSLGSFGQSTLILFCPALNHPTLYDLTAKASGSCFKSWLHLCILVPYSGRTFRVALATRP